jgi:hypothetical protein
MYFVGEGLPVDFAEAYFWIALAAVMRETEDAEVVHSTAAFLLDEIVGKLTPDQAVKAKQRVGDWKAASTR